MRDAQAWHAKIGKFCSVATGAVIGLGEHPSREYVSTHPIFYAARPWVGMDFLGRDHHDDSPLTVIGNDVWIGAHALIKAGITIGDGAIIGAGAVVTHDVPCYAVVVGVPARVLRSRFDDASVQYLLNLRWWDKSDEWLREHVELFRDLKELVDKVPVSTPVRAITRTAEGAAHE
ncbi:MAG TPA: CatB-related O-acetyltransferase [Tepidisphaeraceae bacterium]|jgi:acetyltransferase-like isoleucine patch superfamily enzyme